MGYYIKSQIQTKALKKYSGKKFHHGEWFPKLKSFSSTSPMQIAENCDFRQKVLEKPLREKILTG